MKPIWNGRFHLHPISGAGFAQGVERLPQNMRGGNLDAVLRGLGQPEVERI